MPGRMEFEFRWSSARQPRADRSRRDDAPFDVLVLADLEGTEAREASETVAPRPARPVLALDSENFEPMLRRVAPRIRLDGAGRGGAPFELSLEGLEAFHPETLLQRVPALTALASLRDAVRDPRTFHSVAAELREAQQAGSAGPPSPPQATEDVAPTIERLLGRAPTRERNAGSSADGIVDDLVRRAVAPHVVPDADPRQADLLRSVEDAIGERLRSVLRDPAFQRAESRWRALHRLVHTVEVGGPVRVLAVSVSREELTRDLARAEAPSRSELVRALERAVQEGGTGAPALLVSDLAFGADLAELLLLAGLGALAAHLTAPLLAEARPSLAGAVDVAALSDPASWSPLPPETARAWDALRRSPFACWIGLALPRVLARVPYGATTDPIDALPFEEASDAPPADAFLWSSPAFLCAEAIARTAAAGDPDPMRLAGAEVGELPFALLAEPGGRRVQPCVEARLPDRAAERLLNDGFIPLVASGATPAVRILRLQSIAMPLAPLGG